MCYWAARYNKPLVFEHCIRQCKKDSINRVFDYYADQGLTFMQVIIKHDSHEVGKKLLQLGFSKFNYAPGDLHRVGNCYSCQDSLFTNAKKKAEEKNIHTNRTVLFEILVAAGANYDD